MFNFTRKEPAPSICYVTHGTMGHLDPKQAPTKRKPFSAILAMPYIHKIELLLPEELYKLVEDELSTKFSKSSFSRVIMSLSELLEGDFFSTYIKKGNILMLSEGRHGINNVYSLKDGILTLSLDKESYERTGLDGRPCGLRGRRSAKVEWIVELNLRLPSMLHGRKGFDRLVYAFKNVLNRPVTWLFADLETEVISPNPLDKHFPTSVICTPRIFHDLKFCVPNLQPPQHSIESYGDEFQEFSAGLLEWLSLISLGSPRVLPNDNIDPFLSRYSLPGSEISCISKPEALIRVTWQGFMPASLAHEIFVSAAQRASTKMWLSVFVGGFEDNLSMDSKDCTVLKLPSVTSEYVMWEVEQR